MDFDPENNNLNHRNARRDEEEIIDGPSSDESLYALLNVPKDATTEEIKKRYRTLAATIHPDKIHDDSHRAAMSAQFQKVTRAYEILTDPNKRAVYDLLGEEGLKTKWDVGPKYKTAEELRNEYARLARAAKLQDAENIVRSQGELICTVNALSLTEPHMRWDDRLLGVSQAQLGLKHKFDTDISDRTRLTFTSRLISMKGRAGGNVFGTLKHQFSPRLQLEATSGLLEPRTIVPKLTFEVNDETTIRAESSIVSLRDVPRLTLTGQRLLDPTLTGVISFTTPTFTAPSALAFSLSSTNGLATTVELSPAKLQLSAQYGIRIGGSKDGKDGVLVSASAATGLNQGGLGMMFELNGTAQVAEATSVRLGVGAALPGGVSLRIQLNRLGQRIILPIQLSRDFDLNLALYTAVVPSVAALLINQYIIKPRRQRLAKGRIEALRERQAEILAEDRRAAEEYNESVREQLARKVETERASDGKCFVTLECGGLRGRCFVPAHPVGSALVGELSLALSERAFTAALIILDARYGPTKNLDDSKAIDVVVPLQMLVNGSQLAIPGGRSKAGLLGFYDPCLGERKSLHIKYMFKSRLHQVTVEDKAPVEMPLRGHVIM